jgi:hypothetical protein
MIEFFLLQKAYFFIGKMMTIVIGWGTD